MKVYRFNTNIEHQESLQQISGVINQDRRIISFKVNSQDAMHQMEVSCSDDISETEVRNLVSKAGFETFDIQEDRIQGGAGKY
jgi:hypothetical protein